jgi:acyl-CoA oxidase
VSLGRAHVERWILEQVIAESKSAADADPLVLMRHLYALGRIEADRGWFLENNVIEGNKSKAIRALVTQLCLQVRPLAVGLVDAFGIPEAVLRAPIASSIDPRPSQG